MKNSNGEVVQQLVESHLSPTALILVFPHANHAEKYPSVVAIFRAFKIHAHDGSWSGAAHGHPVVSMVQIPQPCFPAMQPCTRAHTALIVETAPEGRAVHLSKVYKPLAPLALPRTHIFTLCRSFNHATVDLERHGLASLGPIMEHRDVI